jgi:hypothetical protein
MPWQAKPGCAKHHIAAIERLVNSFPSAWLLPPQTNEIFTSRKECYHRLRTFALAEGFNIVRNGGGAGTNPAWRFRNGSEPRNQRKLEARVEKDDDGRITSKRQRGHTNVHQLECPWGNPLLFQDRGQATVGGERGPLF